MSQTRDDRLRPDASPIAIIGIGCMFPGAEDLESYWANIRDGVDSIDEIPETHWRVGDYFDGDPGRPDHTYARRGGFLGPVDFDPLAFGIAPRDVEATDTSQLLGLVCAQRALTDAGYGPEGREFDRERTSVVLGVTGALELVIPLGARLGHPIWRQALREAGVDQTTADEVVRRIGDGYVDWQENSFPGLLGNVVAGRIANRLDLHGTNCVVDAACASSLSAIHLASLELQSGGADLAISGGVDTFNDIFMYMCFSKTPALSPSGDARPFDQSADGTALGEGIGLVVLKRLADAQRDGDRIYSVIRSIGCASDGGGTAIYAPNAAGQARAIRRAYASAGVSPATIELVEAHGTGTKVGDATEVNGLTQVYTEGSAAPLAAHCALGSVKANIGHTKAAAGAAGLIKATLALQRQVLPPTIKVDAPNEALAASPLYVNSEKRPWVAPADHPRRAAVSAFGFGGSNFHCLLEEAQPRRDAADWDGRVQLLAFSGSDPAALAAQLERVEVGSWAAVRALGAETRRAFDATQPCRLTLVLTRDGAPAQQRIEAALAGLRDPDATRWGLRDLYFGNGPAPGKLAALFPGQGAQYVGMLRDLACAFPAFRDALSQADRTLDDEGLADGAPRLSQRIYPQPTFTDEARAANEAALRATDVAQPALGAVSLAAWRVLTEFGVEVAAAAGHSYGELVALCAAGRLSAEDLPRVSHRRGALMAAPRGDRGTMLAVVGDVDALPELLREHRLDLVVANRNSPRQVVLSGATAEIERAAKLLAGPGRTLKRLAVAAAFHSPLVAEASGPFGDALAGIALGGDGAFPVFANTTAAPYPSDETEARRLLAGQLAAPVDFVGCVQAMAEAGIRDFVEIGPGARLGRLAAEILDGTDSMQVALDATSGSGSGVVDLARTLAALAARGHRVALERWDATYKPPAKNRGNAKLLLPLSGANYVAPKPQRAAATAPPAAQASRSPMAPQPTAPPTAPQPSVPEPGAVLAPPPAVRSVPPMSKPDRPEGPAADTTLLSEALRTTEASMQALVQLQGQTAALHRQFLAGQEQATRSFENLVQRQQQMFASQLGLALPDAPPLTAADFPSAIDPSAVGANAVHLDAVSPASALQTQPVVSAPQAQTEAATVPSAPEQAPAVLSPEPAPPTSGGAEIVDALLEVVSEKTGYPSEMLELSMDLHGDLGIDSIKRVEILGGLQEKLPSAPQIGAEHLGRLRTLGQIVDFLSDQAQGEAAPAAPAPATAPAPAAAPGPAGPTAVTAQTQASGESGQVDPSAAPAQVAPAQVASYPLVLRALEPAGATDATALPAGARLWVSRSGDGVSEALVAELGARGYAAEEVPCEAVESPPADLSGLVVVWPSARSQATAPRPSADSSAHPADEQLRRCFALARAVGPTLRRNGNADGALFATISRLDGCFGLGELTATAEVVSGGLAGLSKTAHHEWPGVCCKTIDLSASLDDAAQTTQQLCDRLLQPEPGEIGLDGDRAWSLALAERQAQASDSSHATAEGVTFGPDDLVLVTGGARGITAAVAIGLARAGQPKLALLGRSPAPAAEDPEWARGLQTEAEIKRALAERASGKPDPRAIERQYRELIASREIRTTLDDIRAAGASVAYRSVDVRDPQALRVAIDEISAQHGPVTGLIHGAGVLADRMIEDKSDEDFARVYQTKVGGLRGLLAALESAPLRALVTFSSSTARFGRRGQVDYAMANEVLNKLAQAEARRRSDCRVVSLNWGPWDGGMVTPGLKPAFRSEGIELIDVAAGVRCLIDELARPTSPVEVVVLGAGSRRPDAAASAYSTSANTGAAAPVAHGAAPPTVFDRTICPDTHPFLRDHVIDAKPVLPVALIVEWLAHGALHDNPGLRFAGVDALRVLKGVVLEHDQGAALRVRAGNAEAGAEQGQRVVPVELCSAKGNGQRVVYCTARVQLAARAPASPEPALLSEQPAYPHAIDTVYRSLLFHGETFRGLSEVVGCGAEGIVGVCKRAPRPDRWMDAPTRNRWIAEPLALDSAFQLLILWSIEQTGMPCLPVYLDSYRQYRASWPQTTRIVARIRSHEQHLARADVDWLAADGEVVARLSGYQCAIDGSLRPAFERNRLESSRAVDGTP